MKRRTQRTMRTVAVLVVLALLLCGVPFEARAWAAACCTVAGGEGYPAVHGLDAPPADALALRAARTVPVFKMVAVLPTGSLGLPGEPIIWVLTVNNEADVAVTDLIVSDLLRPELQIDAVETERGDAAVSDQMVIVTVPTLAPGESVSVTLFTTVRRSPTNGILVNQALLAGSGPTGPVNQTATAEVFVPTGLPPTGYPPAGDLPGSGEPSLVVLSALAFGSILLTAWFVYRRGRRW